MFKHLALVLILGVGSFASSAHAQESSNPYIYYFSDTLNAFIIERADGTDTRVLGEGLMGFTASADNIYVIGPGWSPSGQWFAWTAAQAGLYGYSGAGFRPYAFQADGTRRLTLLDRFADAQLAWSNSTDVLFVASRQVERLKPDDPDDTHSVMSTYLALIDVETEAIIALYEDETVSNYNLYYSPANRPDVTRTNDGGHFIASLVDFEGGDSYNGTILLVMLGIDGSLTEKSLDAFGSVSIDYGYQTFPSISSAGWVAYPTEVDFRAENLLSGQQLTFESLDDLQQIYWDAGGQYAMLVNDHLWWLDCTTGSLTLLHENWEFDNTFFRGERPIWSPDSSYALMLGPDNILYAFERTTGTLWDVPIIDAEDRYSPYIAWYWRDDTHVVIYAETEPGIFIYDPVSFSLEHIDVDMSLYSQPRLSSDGRYIAFIDEGAVIYDTVTEHYQKLRPSYRGFNTAPGFEIYWDDTDEWLLLFEDALAAGGANIRNLGIARADGTLRRDLSFSWTPNSLTLNWLPPHVDPANLPPPLEMPLVPQPVKTFNGLQWPFQVDWSPDGRFIVTGADFNEVILWDAATGEILHYLEGIPNPFLG